METVLVGDALENLQKLEEESVNVCVTSPPYYNLRDYEADGQIGMEATPEDFVEKLVAVFREVRRVLRRDGTLWVDHRRQLCHALREAAPDKHKKQMRAHRKEAANWIQIQGPDRGALASGICPAGGWMVSAAGHRLEETKLYAGKRAGPLHKIP